VLPFATPRLLHQSLGQVAKLPLYRSGLCKKNYNLGVITKDLRPSETDAPLAVDAGTRSRFKASSRLPGGTWRSPTRLSAFSKRRFAGRICKKSQQT
jgi:hypothetical protein